jgi:hypothetical protein
MTLNVVQDPIDIEAFENAVHEWFSNSTDLFTIWRKKSSPQPEYPFGSLTVTSPPQALAPLWQSKEEYSAGNPSGQEIRAQISVPCRIVVSSQAHVGKYDSRVPTLTADNYIMRAQAALSLPAYLDHFRANNIAVSLYGPPQNVDQLIEDAWVSRVNLDVTFGATLLTEEYYTFIEQFELKSKTLGVDEVITLP